MSAARPVVTGGRPPKKFVVVVLGLCLAIVAGVVMLRGKKPPASVTAEKFAEIHRAVLRFAAENDRLPETLDEIKTGPREGLWEDAWGFPVRYQPMGDEIELLSFGGDGAPGGSFFKADRRVTFPVRDEDGVWIRSPERSDE